MESNNCDCGPGECIGDGAAMRKGQVCYKKTNMSNALIVRAALERIFERAKRLALVGCPDLCGDPSHPLCWIAREAQNALKTNFSYLNHSPWRCINLIAELSPLTPLREAVERAAKYASQEPTEGMLETPKELLLECFHYVNERFQSNPSDQTSAKLAGRLNEEITRARSARFVAGDYVQVGPDECQTFGTIIHVGTERAEVQYDHGPKRDPLLTLLRHAQKGT